MLTEPPPQSINVVFDSKVFSVDTVKRALYRISDKASPNVILDGNTIICSLDFSPQTSPETKEQIVALLRREVLDQDLRLKIAEESAGIRELILGYVFSKTGLQEDGKIS